MADFTLNTRGDNRVDLTLSGKIEPDEMRSLLDDFLDATSTIERGAMLYTITDFEIPSASAIMVEFPYIPKLLRAAGRFRKIAVIADAAWLRNAAELEGALMPFLKIDAFKPDEIERAEAWLAED